MWENIKKVVTELLQVNVTNENLLFLQFPESDFDREICWLLGYYSSFIWRSSYVKKTAKIHRAQVFGFLKFKYKISQIGARVKLDSVLLNKLQQFDK